MCTHTHTHPSHRLKPYILKATHQFSLFYKRERRVQMCSRVARGHTTNRCPSGNFLLYTVLSLLSESSVCLCLKAKTRKLTPPHCHSARNTTHVLGDEFFTALHISMNGCESRASMDFGGQINFSE